MALFASSFLSVDDKSVSSGIYLNREIHPFTDDRSCSTLYVVHVQHLIIISTTALLTPFVKSELFQPML